MSRTVRLSVPWVPYSIKIADGLMILLAAFAAPKFRQMLDLDLAFPSDLSGYYAMATVAAILFSVLPTKIYRSWRAAQLPSMFISVSLRWLAVVGFILLWLFVIKVSYEFSRIWFFLWVALALSFLCLVRVVAYLILRTLRKHGLNLRHMALVGSGPAAMHLKKQLQVSGWSGYSIALELGSIDDTSLRNLEHVEVNEVWLALPLADEENIKKVLHALRHSTASIPFIPDLFMLRLINHGVTDILGTSMLDLSTSPMTGASQLIKWVEDKILSVLILMALSPLMLILAVGVKISSKGPVFYRQERIGLDGKPFNMLKFRSMPIDTESSEVKWGGSAAKVTSPFGSFIRRTSLDELPQFLNVLKEEMSIVGPGPERPMFVEQFKDEIPTIEKTFSKGCYHWLGSSARLARRYLFKYLN